MVQRAVCKMFPPEYLGGVQFPCLEDLVNSPELSAWRVWASASDEVKSLAPFLKRSGWEALACGRQRKATGGSGALPPIVGFGLPKQEHFQ